MNFLQEHDGKISMMRVSTGMVVFSIMGSFVAHNVAAVMGGLPFVSVGPTEVTLLAMVLGAKAAQRYTEGKTTASKNSLEE